MVGSVLTGGVGANATDGAAMASINEGQIAMDSFMAEGEDSIERLGGASGVITSTSAGAGHGARIWVAMGVAGGKMTGTTAAAGAGGGGATTGSKAGVAATGSKAGAGTDEVGSTMSIMVGAATCSVGVLAGGGGGAATVSVADGAGGGATGSTREGRGGNGVMWSKMGGTGRMKGEGVMVGVIEGGEEGAGRTLGGALG